MHVMVVDDSPIARIALRGMLENEGFTVSEADGGDQALSAAARMNADLVLCDMLMPGSSGLEVVRELRRSLPDVKIIAMSSGRAAGRADLLPTALYHGADEILYKPFTSAALMKAIRQVMVRLAVS